MAEIPIENDLPIGMIKTAVVAALGLDGGIELHDGSTTDAPIRAWRVSDLSEVGFRRAYAKLTAEGHIAGGTQAEGNPVGSQEGDSDGERPPGPGVKELMAARILEMQGKGKTPGGQQKVTTSQLRQVLDELLGDSDKLREVLQKVLEEMKADGSLDETLNLEQDMKELTDTLLEVITTHAQATEERLEGEMRETLREIEAKATTQLEIIIPDIPKVTVKDQHHKFADLMFNLHLREPTLLVGPTGSGKTTAAVKAAEILGLDFSYLALGPTQTESKLSGYQSATGHYIPTEFYLRYRYGGVILLDEIDAANPSVLVWMNGAVQNKIATFPRGVMTDGEKAFWPGGDKALKDWPKGTKAPKEAGGMVTMHPDTVIIASANTVGKGADMMYHGRNALDASSLKRFRMILWEYDTNLEHKLAPLTEWTNYVIAVRESVTHLRIPHPVSPVDSIAGGKMILAGKPWTTVADETVFAGLKPDEVQRILNNTNHAKNIATAQGKLVNWQKQRDAEKAAEAGRDADAKPKVPKKAAAQESAAS